MAYVRIISPDVRIVDDLAFVDICIFHQLALLLNCRSDGVIVCCGVVGYLRSYRRGILRGDVARSLSISSSGSERSKSTEEDERRSLSPASTSWELIKVEFELPRCPPVHSRLKNITWMAKDCRSRRLEGAASDAASCHRFSIKDPPKVCALLLPALASLGPFSSTSPPAPPHQPFCAALPAQAAVPLFLLKASCAVLPRTLERTVS